MEVVLPEIELEMTLRELYGSVGKEVFFIPTNVELEIRPNTFRPKVYQVYLST